MVRDTKKKELTIAISDTLSDDEKGSKILS
jgi:hypothetical protein